MGFFRCFSLSGTADTGYLLADDLDGGGVGGEDGIEALGFLCGVTSIGIAYLPLLMGGIGLAAPAPEVTAGKIAAGEGVLGHKTENVAVVGIADGGGALL